MKGRLAVVLKGYPRLSETFIAQELRALELAGARLTIFAMRHPQDRKTHPIHAEIVAPIHYLPEYLHWEAGRVCFALLRAARLPGFRRAIACLLGDLVKDLSRDRLRRFGQAAVLAVELPPDTSAIYAHFIHTPSSVARYASLLSGLSWMCSAHAKDIWTSPDWELEAKLASAQWAVTCTEVGRERLAKLAPQEGRVRLMYHGLDLARFPAVERAPDLRDGSDPMLPVRLLAVGRAVPKKGLDLLVDALAALPADLHWRLTHVGGGSEREALVRRAAAAGLADRVTWAGAMDQPGVLQAYRTADLFVLPCRVMESGDRDGLPNVLMEAQSQALACISTTAGGISELIDDGVTGLLVPPADAPALAIALEHMIRHPDERTRLGRAGERRVRTEFDASATIGLLLGLLAVDGTARRTAGLGDVADAVDRERVAR